MGEPRKVDYDAVEEMEVFDRLPARIRKALNDSPVKYVHVRSMLRYRADEIDTVAKLIRAGKLPSIKVKVDCN